MEKFTRLVVVPALMLATAFLLLSSENNISGFLDDGAIVIGRDFYEKYIDSRDCVGLYDCVKSICEIYSNNNVTRLMIIVPFGTETNCEISQRCIRIDDVISRIFLVMAAVSVINSIVFAITNNLIIAGLLMASQTTSRFLIIILVIMKDRTSLCWEYNLSADIVFSAYLVVDLIMYCLYIRDVGCRTHIPLPANDEFGKNDASVV